MSDRKLPKMGDDQVENLGKVVVGMLAIGLTAGFALIAGADKLGRKMIEHQIRKEEAEEDDE